MVYEVLRKLVLLAQSQAKGMQRIGATHTDEFLEGKESQLDSFLVSLPELVRRFMGFADGRIDEPEEYDGHDGGYGRKDSLEINFSLDLFPEIIVSDELVRLISESIVDGRVLDFEVEAELADDIVYGEGGVYSSANGDPVGGGDVVGWNEGRPSGLGHGGRMRK